MRRHGEHTAGIAGQVPRLAGAEAGDDAQDAVDRERATAATCGVPSAFVVANQYVKRFGPPVSRACESTSNSSLATASQAMGGVP